MATFFENFKESFGQQPFTKYEPIAPKGRQNDNEENLFVKKYRTVSDDRASQQSSVIPKAPAFKYKDPTVDNNIAYWRLFVNDGIMSRYDDLMGILDKTDEIDTLEGKREFMNQLKDTTEYKDNKSIQTWVNDLESEFYGMGAKELSYPTAMMRNQMAKAKKEYEKEIMKN